jgi:Flp pilus assembly protein TadG
VHSPALGGPPAERGSTVVEFALVLPIMLLICLALVQIGILARDELLLVQAARAGARQAAVEPDDGTVRSSAETAAPGLDPARLEVVVERLGGWGSPVRVTVAYDASIAVPIAGWLLPPEVRLRASTVMRQEFA